MLVICRLNSPVPCPEARLDKTVREEGASMHVIADWLEKLGMSKYAERFTENKIDVPVLRHSTDQRNHNVLETNGPFWKTGFVLWVLALCGVFPVFLRGHP